MKLNELRQAEWDNIKGNFAYAVAPVAYELHGKHLRYQVPVPATPMVINYLLNYMNSHANTQWSFLEDSWLPIEADVKVLRYLLHGGDYRYIFVKREGVAEVTNKIALIEVDAYTPAPDTTVEYYEEYMNTLPDSYRLFIKWYLHHLGLREKDEETPDDTNEAPVPSSLLDQDNTVRFSSALWYDKIKEKKILIAGMGGIGSWCALLLARSDVGNLFLVDDDVVDPTNLAGQMFSMEDVGVPKVNAVINHMREFCNYHRASGVQERFTEESAPNDIMICGFDNMSARRCYFNAWVNHVRNIPGDNRSRCLFMDGRLSADTLQVFTITGDNDYGIREYANTYLFTDSEADETVCSFKQTSYMANMIGGIMANIFINFVANEVVPQIMDVPFFVEYDAKLMTLKSKE